MNMRLQKTTAFQDDKPSAVVLRPEIHAFVAEGGRVRVSVPGSDWHKVLQKRFNELTSLPKGWDGYRGVPVSFTCAQFAASLLERIFDPDLPAPSLVPGSDGTVQIEWHRNQYDVEIDILAPRAVIATRFDHATGLAEELELDSDFTDIAGWMIDLKTQRAQ